MPGLPHTTRASTDMPTAPTTESSKRPDLHTKVSQKKQEVITNELPGQLDLVEHITERDVSGLETFFGQILPAEKPGCGFL